jgi:hypothetical protein
LQLKEDKMSAEIIRHFESTKAAMRASYNEFMEVYRKRLSDKKYFSAVKSLERFSESYLRQNLNIIEQLKKDCINKKDIHDSFRSAELNMEFYLKNCLKALKEAFLNDPEFIDPLNAEYKRHYEAYKRHFEDLRKILLGGESIGS